MGGEADTKAGPERPTFAERVVALLPLPYAWACLVWALLFGVAFQLLGGYLDTFDIGVAARTLLYPELELWQGFAIVMLNTVLYCFFPLFLVRFMRTKLVRSEEALVSVSPHGEETLHRVFGGVSRVLPPLLIGGAIVGLSSLPGASTPVPTTGPIQTASQFAFYLFAVLMGLGSFIWVYLISLRGIHRLGRERLNLKPASEDPMLGLRPLGSMSLTFSFAYFTIITLGLLFFFIIPLDFASSVIYPILIAVGLVMFFLPLRSIHRQMQDAKKREQKAIREQLSRLTLGSGEQGKADPETTLVRIERLMMIQTLKGEVSGIPTWPFDTSMLGRFVAIILSVVTVLLARLVTLALHI